MTAATFEKTCPYDAIGRPVRIRASGMIAWVTQAEDHIDEGGPTIIGSPSKYPDCTTGPGIVTVQSMAGDIPWDVAFNGDAISGWVTGARPGGRQAIIERVEPEPIGEPIQISLWETDPLCIDCCEPLEEAAGIYPGVCVNSSCFLFEKP